jgi:DnaJ-class molecular chaperone
MAKNYYLILNVTSDASQEQIKSAYRQKAKELHPDYYGDDREPFQSVQEAYSVLIDPARRRAHDEVLRQERQSHSRQQRTSDYRRYPNVEPLIPEHRTSRVEDLSSPRSVFTDLRDRRYQPSFDELFDRLWSNFSAFGHPKAEHPENLTVEILLSSEEARRGGRVRIALPVQQACSACGGQGWIGPFGCMRCRGTGVLTGEYPVEISYPPDISESYLTQLSLDSIGIQNLYLTVYFRVSD